MGEVVLDDRHIAEKVAQQDEWACPAQRAHDIVGQEEFVIHAAGAGDKRRKGAGKGNEAGENNGFAAMLGEELLRRD